MTDDVDRERRYRMTLSVVQHNTGGNQQPGCTPRVVYQTLVSQGKFSRPGVEDAIQAALDNGDIIAWKDRERQTRLTRTLEDDLRELIAHENSQLDPTTELIEQAARHIEDSDQEVVST